MSSTPALSEYEQLREANIARNRAVMVALGLVDADVRLHDAGGAKQAAKKKRAPAAPPREGERRSKRARGLDPAGAPVPRPAADGGDGDESNGTHASELAAERNAGQQRRATIVGTASYAHTLMRVRSMSEDALWTRMNKIEKAKGRHAVTKMRLFARVAYLERLYDLADACKDALERLVDALGDPKDDETTDAPAPDLGPAVDDA